MLDTSAETKLIEAQSHYNAMKMTTQKPAMRSKPTTLWSQHGLNCLLSMLWKLVVIGNGIMNNHLLIVKKSLCIIVTVFMFGKYI